MTGQPSTITNALGTQSTASYDKYGRITNQAIANAGSLAYTYSGENLTKVTRTANSTTQEYNFTYAYKDGSGSNTTTTLVSSKNNKWNTTNIQNFTYQYDALGRITQEKDTVANRTTNYTYDVQGQLLTATTTGTGAHSETYTYDAAGNIKTFNNGTDSHRYTYGNSNWKDLLTAVDGHTITYDAIGNPTSYYNGYGMTWTEGRQLKTLTNNGTTYTYSYDRNGLRTRKQGSDGSEIRYHNVDGKPVVEVRWGAGFIWDCTLSYEYDETGSIIGFSYIQNGAADWTKYHLAKNLMGDVVAVYDDNGTTVASYTYDAWGNVLTSSISGTMTNMNPFRYRGYYYDSETGFYYLQSRYYDSAIGRFINADSFTTTGNDILGYNMFAYCGNCPITGYDPEGTWDWGNFFKGSGWIATGVAAVAVGVSVLTCGVAAPAMMAVAAVTVTAGVATTVNGVSEIGEAATGHNFMRDDVFRGNSTAYNIYSTATAVVAQVGTAVCGGWMAKNAPRINAYKSMDTYNVKGKHLSTGSGSWSKFNTSSQAELQALGKEVLKNSPMKSLLPNSVDSYAAIYNCERVIGTSGQTSARLVFSTAGKIITFFPQ